jgi:hypothetical protein
MKEESCGVQTFDLQSGPPQSYSLLSDGSAMNPLGSFLIFS